MSLKKNYGADALNSFAARFQEARQLEEQVISEDPAIPHPFQNKPAPKSSAKTVIEVQKKGIPKVKSTESHTENSAGEYIQYGMQIRKENVEFIKKIKYLEAISFVDIVNGIFDEERKKKESALDAAIAEIEARRKAWRK